MSCCLRFFVLTSFVPELWSQFIEPGRVATLGNIGPSLVKELGPLLEEHSRTVRQLWNNVPFSSNIQNAITDADADALGSSSKEESYYFLRDVVLQDGITFDQNTNVSVTCANDTYAYLMGIVRQQQWALRILDSQGKLPSGILLGNRYWLGSYTECLKASATLNISHGQHRTLTTKYCAVQIPLGGTGGESPDQQTPGFMSMGLMIGMCVPRSCSQDDVTGLLDEAMSLLPMNTSSQISVSCRESPDLASDGRAIAAIVICSVIGFCILVGTVYDVCILQIASSVRSTEKRSAHSLPDEKTALLNKTSGGDLQKLEGPPKLGILAKCLVAFSVYTNGSKILSTAQAPGSLTCLNGIRFLSMSWVILGHTYAIMLIVSDNLIDYGTVIFKRWTFQAIVNGTFSVDSFFFLSGLLVAYITFKEMDKSKGRINWALFYFHRFWRLTPAYMLVMMVDICLLRYFGDGPIWPQQGLEVNFCKDSWWKNLLYINNFFSFYSGCMSWAWYLANDMQFYVISPLVLITLYRSKVAGTAVLMTLLTGSFITTGVISSVNKLPPTGNDLNQDFTKPNLYQDLYYEKPYCRIGPYLVGMTVGYILYRTGSKISFTKKVVVFGWILTFTCNLAVLYGLYGHFNTEPLTSDVSALYNTVSRTVWALGLAWLVIACSSGNGGVINSLLSWAPFQPLGRLTYCAYLIHPLVMLYFATGRDVVPHASDLNTIYYFLGHIVLSYGLAFLVSLAFEAPMIGLERVLLRGDRKRAEK
ncbi:nose resistant to fluoxetine protein 6-like [Liolophura sinensis]|uniref:nose resistant to fluoxetine protein 6-like n=1 Tax=Liolophura sinensis TaxID=3198878 RepID=UPI00315880B7